MKEKKTEEKPRKKVVVEEVASTSAAAEATPQIDKIAAATEAIPESPRIPEKFAPKPTFHPPGRKLKYLWFIIPLLLILGALGGGIYVFTKGASQNKEEATAQPTIYQPLPSPTPTPTPTKIDLSKYTIAIQNGSGIGGEATRVQKILTSAGFKVVSIGNAKTYDYTKTIVVAKDGVEDAFLTQLANTLSKTYVLDKNQGLSDKEKTDIVIIVGKTKS